jgi:hypothetical protein
MSFAVWYYNSILYVFFFTASLQTSGTYFQCGAKGLKYRVNILNLGTIFKSEMLTWINCTWTLGQIRETHWTVANMFLCLKGSFLPKYVQSSEQLRSDIYPACSLALSPAFELWSLHFDLFNSTFCLCIDEVNQRVVCWFLEHVFGDNQEKRFILSLSASYYSCRWCLS